MSENNLKGTTVYSGIVPTNTSDVYPTHSAIYGMGGFRSVQTATERDQIPVERLEVGAKVLVTEEEENYYVKSIDDGVVTWDLETALYADKLIATPTIYGTWSFKNNSGSSVTSSEVGVSNVNASSITIERGYVVDFTGYFTWTKTDSNKAPTSCSGSLGTTLPSSGEPSPEVTISDISSTTTISVTLSAAKKGFMVSGTSVVQASGNDTSTASFYAYIYSRRYYGVTTSASPNEDEIKALASTSLTNSKSLTVSSVTPDSDQYYCYAYPTSLGTLTSIIQDGAAPILTDFNQTTVSLTNNAGLTLSYYVYTSKYTGAFRSASIAFS